jgi:hypothetical protein
MRSIRAEFLVELRGFEPMAIVGAVRSRGIPPFAGQCAQPLFTRSNAGIQIRGADKAARDKRARRHSLTVLAVAARAAADQLACNEA